MALRFDPAVFDPAIFDPGSDAAAATRRRKRPMILTDTPLGWQTEAAPASSTAMGDLVAIPSGTTGLLLQAQGGGVRVSLSGANATSSSFLLADGEYIQVQRRANADTFLDDIKVIRDDVSANLHVTFL